MKRLCLLVALIFMAGIHTYPAYADAISPYRGSMIIKVIPLDFADAEHLASVLRPLLTKDGTIIAHPHSNSLIIKDRRSLVEELVRIIKGPDKAEDNFVNSQDGPPELD